MNQNPHAVKFIEEHVDLLEENKLIDFLITANEDPFLGVVDLFSVVLMLEQANILTEDERKTALNEIINMSAEGWYESSSGVSALPINDFIEAFLQSRLGYMVDQVAEYMLNNEDNWDKYMYLTSLEDGTIIVEKRFKFT